MITNLFSFFDPTLSVMNLIPASLAFFLFFIPILFWSCSYLSIFLSKFFGFLVTEVIHSLGSLNVGVVNVMGSVLVMLCLFNFLALFPFIFSLTSHISITFPLSFSLWFIVITFSWFNFMSNFLSHLIPVGTPVALMSFIVLVELISNLIRPIALTFRLTANMIAGHLLISLIGGALISLNLSFMILGSLFQMLLVFMELGVSVIQAYVFFTLLVLYISEVNPH